ncbi:maleylpyruvate isomerase family mycothiol-dependent enzyme [Nocardioides seonyuensis]|uniref:Maleylpyruvate isomerase family mycothiol-dependent enzyme n=1 Tax=Nocardioides seonyuensis TaxID=2518371 RepID=A0A4P7ICS6_9ACTN|nr:maleylpyruvate isomerase family mycothiol-dependent enzyme [Nocardioides seonyuensis]QBX54420.1 maleylpyruvate isomerase family mycothiol-dependent enzyme [Nocardioides seonyuensis]
MDIWTLVREDRLALADLLEGLTPEQWSTDSLCSAWTVKDVAAHVAPTVGGGLLQFLVVLAGAGFNPHKASERIVRDSGHVPMAAIVADLRDHADQQKAPPGLGTASQLADVLVHTLDVAVPLGLPVDRPAEHWQQALTWLVGPQARRGFVGPDLPEVTLVAQDVEWTHGQGPRVQGSAAALALALCGRSALLDDLSGPGAEALAQWVRGPQGGEQPLE